MLGKSSKCQQIEGQGKTVQNFNSEASVAIQIGTAILQIIANVFFLTCKQSLSKIIAKIKIIY